MVIYPLPALLTPLPLIPITTEEITGSANEVAKGAQSSKKSAFLFFSLLLFHAVLFKSLYQLIHPNLDTLSLAKGVTTFPRAVLPKLPNKEPKKFTWLNYFRYVSLTKFYICYVISKTISYFSCLSCC